MGKLFSYKNRPAHLGGFPLEKLARIDTPELGNVPAMQQVLFRRPSDATSIVNAMQEYQAMLDATRDGLTKIEQAEIPGDLIERANHLKSYGYYCDTSMVGICEIPKDAWLAQPFLNPDVKRLAEKVKTMQPKTFAAGVDATIAGLRESMSAPPTDCSHHTHAIVLLYEYPRDPAPSEPGCEWLSDAQPQRACLRGAETAVTMSNYVRLLGHQARGHSQAASDIDLGKLAVAAGLAVVANGELQNPFLGARFGLAVITTTLEIAADKPLAANPAPGFSWKSGLGPHAKNAGNFDPYAKRDFKDGPHPFETLKRVDKPTTYIDEPNVARVPKRANMFARALFGDLGLPTQESSKNGNYVRKSATAFSFRPSLGAFIVLQDGEAAPKIDPATSDATRNANNIKAALYFLGIDAVGLSHCPDWAYYSHDAVGEVIVPYHKNAISMIVDQGHETMEGASGDDWIACAQSMRAYLRFSLIGGVIAQQIRNLGYTARVHSVMDDEVLHPPLLLLAGLGEVSRIGEVILNPFLGPRLKSGIVTTDMPLKFDKPIDFGLQKFCNSCNKCARECPSGAITAGPKLMFNGYEIWKSDSQKCATYRITTSGGAMCGRCMKTCPWNLEGLFAEKPFRWAAMTFPAAAPALAKLDDIVGNGGLNPVKKWWWDIELEEDGGYHPTQNPVNARGLQKDLDLKYEDQTLAVYPAHIAPHPYPYPFPMDREAGIEAYQAMITADEYKARHARGETGDWNHVYSSDGESPVLRVEITSAVAMTPDVTKYEFSSLDGSDLPEWTAGAHLDIVVAPEFLRQYSMSGDPADRSKFQVGVLREDGGRGGSALLHRIFNEGRKIFISRPINHFPLDETATRTLLMGGGIGITPMIAMAHRLHVMGANFEVHYSVSGRDTAGYLDDLAAVPWADHVTLHISNEGSRADLDVVLSGYSKGWHVYACGPDRFMNSVTEAAERQGFTEEAVHIEYFSVPELPEYENHDFTLRLKDGREYLVPADRIATDILAENGIHIDVKCSDGICGVCKCGLISGEVEHRDFVLSKAQRETAVILCQSRAAKDGGVIEVDL